MTLTRLVLAWLPVTAEFLIVSGFQQPAGEQAPSGPRWALTRREAMWRSLEAAAVTLFASLWFDSLGHGGWWPRRRASRLETRIEYTMTPIRLTALSHGAG